MATSDKDLIKALQFRRKSMDSAFDVYRSSFEEAASWIDPARGIGLNDDRSGTDRRKQRILIDSTPRKAFRTIRAGLMSGLSSPSRPWFKLKLAGYEEVSHQAQVWLDECQRRMYEVFAASNLYNALAQCYGDLALFGTYGGVIRSSRESIIHCQSYPMGSFVYAENEYGTVDTLHWSLDMTIRQIVSTFGLENVSDRIKRMHEQNQQNQTLRINAAIEPRLERDPMSPAASNMPFGVYYWEDKSHDEILKKGGRKVGGILAPRWETVEGNPWPSSSPGRDAVGDVRQLQAQQRDKDMAIQMGYRPPLVGPAMNNISYLPGAYNPMTVADLSKGAPRPLLEGVRIDLNAMIMNIQETQGRVNEAMFADLFRMASEYGIEGGKNVTATFISEIKEEKLIVLGPVLESLDRGLLAPAVETTFHYMQEADILPIAPDDVVGAKVQVEFIGLLAQAQRSIGVSQIERAVGFAGTLAQLKPDVLDNINGDEMLRDFSRQVGLSSKNLREPTEVEQQREAAAQQAQQQMLLENAQPLAGAANLLSEASARGVQGLGTSGAI